MASSSSSINMIPHIKYDVFLSFRGEDVRHHFISHLNAALCRKKIVTFIDDKLDRGDEISPSLSSAIEGSKISIVIFSEGYASSRWCLNELVKILESKNKYGQIVVPVFYRVDPSDVSNQTGTFGDSFSKLEERLKEKIDMLQTWRIVMREAANLSGFDSHVIRSESVFIERIVDDILKKLNNLFPSDNKDQLVGVESIIKEIESLLMSRSTDFNIVGIWGIGGIGKTTIANAIYRNISSHFEGSYFMQNIREESERLAGGLAGCRRELLSTLLDDVNMKIDIPNICLNFERRRLSRMKVLIVFDDVTCLQQIELLIGGLDRLDCFMPGSRIIITTRDAQLLKNLPGSRVGHVFEVKELSYKDSLTLFNRSAFGQNHPAAGYLELSNLVIKYAGGVPLALKVLGRHLFGRSEEEWESAIKKLKRIPHMDVQKVLKVSYDGLDDEEQNIFLDIACFLKGEHRDFVMNFLDACGFSAKIGICALVDKSLVTISNNKITMHDLLQEMGREIVRQESIKDPGKRSRLWHHEDIYQVFNKNIGSEAIEGISLDMSKVKEICLNPNTFTKMLRLRFFKFYTSIFGENKCKVHHLRSLEPVFNELRYFRWDGYPLKSLPSKISPEHLVSLEMRRSNIGQLWNGVQNLPALKLLNLSYSEQLTRVPDLSLALNLEELDLSFCKSLIEIPSSIQHLNKLVFLDLSYCISLKSFPTGINLDSLKRLCLEGCTNFKRFPEISCNIEVLDLGGTAIEELPSTIGNLSRLVELELTNCSRLKSVSSSLCNLKSLQSLILSGCLKLEKLPDEIGNLESLTNMWAYGTAISQIPSSIACLNKLQTLYFGGWRPNLAHCMGLRSFTKLSSGRGIFACQRTSLERLSNLSSLFTTSPLDFQIFHFGNCFKLNRNLVRDIVEGALKRIQEHHRKHARTFLCYPGSEIPEWFRFRSMGSFVTLELPPGWFNNNFVSFALCAIVPEYHGDTRGRGLYIQCKLKTEDGDGHVNIDLRPTWNDDFGVNSSIESDHVFLSLGRDFSVFSDSFSGSNNEICIQFYIRDWLDRCIEGLDVKKCGAHLICA